MRTITQDEVKAAIIVIQELDLDPTDKLIVSHIKAGSHGWWSTISKMTLLNIIGNKYSNFDFLT